ncbi:hypothetical protein U3516DRAFT_755316 [Neocallimastix sp. 'constans']
MQFGEMPQSSENIIADALDPDHLDIMTTQVYPPDSDHPGESGGNAINHDNDFEIYKPNLSLLRSTSSNNGTFVINVPSPLNGQISNYVINNSGSFTICNSTLVMM